jgi:hypothetical protein
VGNNGDVPKVGSLRFHTRFFFWTRFLRRKDFGP